MFVGAFSMLREHDTDGDFRPGMRQDFQLYSLACP